MPEVPPFLWADAGTFASPKTYTVPGSGEVQPYTATATYVNASGQAILPALRLKSSSGNLLALVFPSATIADSTSAEVSFVPPFGSAAVSVAGGVPSLPVGFAIQNSADQTFTKNVGTVCTFQVAESNNADVFAGLDGGSTNLLVTMAGEYLVLGRIEFNVINDGQHALACVATTTGGGGQISRGIKSDLAGQEQVLSKNAFYPYVLDTFSYVPSATSTANFGLTFTSTGATINATGRARMQVIRLGDVAT